MLQLRWNSLMSLLLFFLFFFFPLSVVTGATDGIGKSYAEEVRFLDPFNLWLMHTCRVHSGHSSGELLQAFQCKGPHKHMHTLESRLANKHSLIMCSQVTCPSSTSVGGLRHTAVCGFLTRAAAFSVQPIDDNIFPCLLLRKGKNTVDVKIICDVHSQPLCHFVYLFVETAAWDWKKYLEFKLLFHIKVQFDFTKQETFKLTV